MKILQIVPFKSRGGTEQYIYELSKNLINNRGFSLHFVSRDFKLNIDIFSKLADVTVLPLRSIIDLFSIVKLGILLRREKIDVIHAHSDKDAIIALISIKIFKRKTKLFVTRHFVREAKRNLIYDWYHRNVYRFICVSERARDVLISTLPSNFKINTTVVYNSICGVREGDANINFRESLNLDESAILVGYAGRIVPPKGPEVLIDAFYKNEIYKDAYLLFAGDVTPEYKERLESKLDKYNIRSRVIFLTYVENIYSFIDQLNIMVIPTIVPEACSLTLLETISRAKSTLVSTDNGSQPELVEDGKEALLVPPSDSDAMSLAIRKIVDDKSLREELAKNAYERSKFFNYDNFVEQIIDNYNS